MEQNEIVADPEGRPADDQAYTVVYLDGNTETVTGLDAVRQRLVDPASRGIETNGMLGGTYARVVE